MPSAIDSAASPRNTTRHDVCVTSHASGAPAITAPRLPANIVTPFNVANRLAGNHTALTLRIAMNATETPTPTSVRPTAAISQVGASANAIEPSARDERARRQEPARSHRVRQHADRNLQHHVHVEIRGGERAQQRAVDGERARELAGDRGGRRAVEERQQEARERDAEDHAARADESRVVRRRRGGMPHCTGARRPPR